jgi:hypothetical protein
LDTAKALQIRDGDETELGLGSTHPPRPHPVLDRTPAMAARADESNWRCLNPGWLGWHVKHDFLCPAGHAVRTTPAAFSRGWATCTECQRQDWTQQLIAAASRDGVQCLDAEWRGVAGSYRFRCTQGHDFNLSPRHGIRCEGNLKCPTCTAQKANEKRRLSNGLARLQELAASRGGVCLSSTYLGHGRLYRFRCRESHEWTTEGSNVLRGSWCLICANEAKRTTYLLADGLAQLAHAAKSKGGQCESTAYLGRQHKYRFVCARGHRWEASGTNILNGGWCLACSLDARRLGLKAAQDVAVARGGRCLSTQYQNTQQKLQWVCHAGHAWQATLGSTKRGHWCPECAHAARVSSRSSKARLRYSGMGRHAHESPLQTPAASQQATSDRPIEALAQEVG